MGTRFTIEKVRQPEYTGENRCLPCTVVNFLIAIILGIGVAVISLPFGIVAFALSVGAISLRGYLIPGTPTLTKRYFPDWVLRRFEKHPNDRHVSNAVTGRVGQADQPTDGDASVETSDQAGEDTVAIEPRIALSEAGVLIPCEGKDDLCLDSGFRAAWREEVIDLRDRSVQAADAFHTLGAAGMDGSLSHYGDAITLEWKDEIGQVAHWESQAALLADVAAARVLERQLSGWSDFESETRSQLLYALRLFVETCPECDGCVSLAAETVESCCRSVDVVVVTCDNCDTRLFEQEQVS